MIFLPDFEMGLRPRDATTALHWMLDQDERRVAKNGIAMPSLRKRSNPNAMLLPPRVFAKD
jgi:hypothetical protein